MVDLERLLTLDEVSEILSVPVSTLRGWRMKGEGPPALKVGRHLRFRREDVDDWIEDRVRQEASKRGLVLVCPHPLDRQRITADGDIHFCDDCNEITWRRS